MLNHNGQLASSLTIVLPYLEDHPSMHLRYLEPLASIAAIAKRWHQDTSSHRPLPYELQRPENRSIDLDVEYRMLQITQDIAQTAAAAINYSMPNNRNIDFLQYNLETLLYHVYNWAISL